MITLSRSLLLLLCFVGISGCLQQNQQKPSLTNSQLETALLESENRLSEKWQNYCEAVNSRQKQQLTSLNNLQSGQDATSRQLSTINEKLDRKPETVVKTETVPVPQNCPTAAGPSFDDKLILGRTEWIWLESINRVFRARVDSGATTSSLSAHDIVEFERDGKRWVRFHMVPDDDVDDSYTVEAPLVRVARIRQASSDEPERRPVVELTIKIGDFMDTAEFTLTDRTAMTYPILLGREFLRDIALIDVAKSYHQPKPEPLKDRPEASADEDDANDGDDSEENDAANNNSDEDKDQ